MNATFFEIRGVDIDVDIFEIKTVHFAKSLHKNIQN